MHHHLSLGSCFLQHKDPGSCCKVLLIFFKETLNPSPTSLLLIGSTAERSPIIRKPCTRIVSPRLSHGLHSPSASPSPHTLPSAKPLPSPSSSTRCPHLPASPELAWPLPRAPGSPILMLSPPPAAPGGAHLTV